MVVVIVAVMVMAMMVMAMADVIGMVMIVVVMLVVAMMRRGHALILHARELCSKHKQERTRQSEGVRPPLGGPRRRLA